MPNNNSIVIALPRGRILREVIDVVRRTGLEPESAFNDPEARQLWFSTNMPNVSIVRVRSFDVATFVAFGGAQIGIAGNDVLMEFSYPEVYTPLDLGVGKCRLVLAESLKLGAQDDPSRWSHVRVATKYPSLTRQYFAERGVQAECIHLNGAMELAPALGLCNRIVDLVSTGETLKANGLVEVERITDVTSRLAVNRAALKTRSREINNWIQKFEEASSAH